MLFPFDQKGYNVVTRVVKTKNQVYSSSPNNKRGIKLTGIAEEGDRLVRITSLTRTQYKLY